MERQHWDIPIQLFLDNLTYVYNHFLANAKNEKKKFRIQ